MTAIVKASDKQRKELERELELVKVAYEDRLSDIHSHEKTLQEVVEIFKDISGVQTWDEWNKKNLNQRVSKFIQNQRIIN